MRGVSVDTSGLADTPSLVIGAGLDDVIHPNEARRTADLLGASYEYFPSASHFGLAMGEHTWPAVAAWARWRAGARISKRDTPRLGRTVPRARLRESRGAPVARGEGRRSLIPVQICRQVWDGRRSSFG